MTKQVFKLKEKKQNKQQRTPKARGGKEKVVIVRKRGIN
jgi:hypothetical protein